MTIKDILKQVQNKTRSVNKRQSYEHKTLGKLINNSDIARRFKDDWDLAEAFMDNAFWKLPEQYNIEELMEEMK